MRAVSASANVALYRFARTEDHIACRQRPVPSTAGRRMARTTLSTAHPARERSFFTSAAKALKAAKVPAVTSAVPWQAGRPLPYPAASWHVLQSRLLAPQRPALSSLSPPMPLLSRASSCFWFSSRAASVSGIAGALAFLWRFAFRLGCRQSAACPAPNTLFIRFSQSSVYAMVCPPFLSFSSIAYPDRLCNSLCKKTAGVYTISDRKLQEGMKKL